MRTRLGRELNVFLLGGAMLLAGCGNKGPSIIPVSGTVTTTDGKPLDKIRVEFHPMDVGDSSTAVTDAEGKFVLQTLQDQKDGAVSGSHRVVLYDTTLVQKYVPVRQAENIDVTEGRKSRIASKYMDKMATPIQVSVSTDSHEFALEVEPYTAPAKKVAPPTGELDSSDPRNAPSAE
ncbi:MAG: hypothetical protein KF861_07460 [Planctomycetaceae bacterium]|nr:hypothetical protein [Planctomycetaceae bacterium]